MKPDMDTTFLPSKLQGEADTIQRNRSVFDPWLFRPRILRDVSNIGRGPGLT